MCTSIEHNIGVCFLKSGLITSKKRQRLTAHHVDGVSLRGWYYKDNGGGQ